MPQISCGVQEDSASNMRVNSVVAGRANQFYPVASLSFSGATRGGRVHVVTYMHSGISTQYISSRLAPPFKSRICTWLGTENCIGCDNS